MLTEPLISEVRTSCGLWNAAICDIDGQLVEPSDIDANEWARDMHIAAELQTLIDPEPRQLIIVHPFGYAALDS